MLILGKKEVEIDLHGKAIIFCFLWNFMFFLSINNFCSAPIIQLHLFILWTDTVVQKYFMEIMYFFQCKLCALNVVKQKLWWSDQLLPNIELTYL